MFLNTMTIRQATPDDFETMIDLIEGAAKWLADQDTDQWAKPWPTAEERDDRILKALHNGETSFLQDGPMVIGTVTLRRSGQEFLWTEEERREPAAYVHQLVVTRPYAGMGIGAFLLDRATEQAVRDWGAVWTRIDVWRTNERLHAYYKGLGFREVRTGDDVSWYPSSRLFQRPVRPPADV